MKRIEPEEDSARILSEAEVRRTTKALRALLRAEFPGMPPRSLTSAEETVRLSSLHARFRHARESRGLTIKEVSARLKVSQYRIRAVEEGPVTEIDAAVLARLGEFLGLREWTSQWSAINRTLAGKLGIP